MIKNGACIVFLKIFNGYVDEKTKIPQYVLFICGLLLIEDSLRKIGKSYQLQESLLKKELEHDENYEDTWEKKESEWLPYLKNYVLSTAFSYATYTIGIEELTRFGKRNSLTLPSLAKKYFNSLRDENDEPIYTYNDEFMRNFVGRSIKGGRCGRFNQCYKSSISDEVFNIISKEINVQGNICEVIEKPFENTNKHRKIIEKNMIHNLMTIETSIKKKELNIPTKNQNKLPIHGKIQKLNLNDVMMVFDATSLYPSAM